MKPCESWLGERQALGCGLARDVLRSFGRLRLSATGWSMLPTIWPGDTLIIESACGDSVSKGEIVLFASDQRLFAHRVIRKIQDAGVWTRGDAMDRPDPFIANCNLLGRVVCIEHDGRSRPPKSTVPVLKLAIAALVRRSHLVARVVVRVHELFLRFNRSNDGRVIPCQN